VLLLLLGGREIPPTGPSIPISPDDIHCYIIVQRLQIIQMHVIMSVV
jgi:hypothetical protein